MKEGGEPSGGKEELPKLYKIVPRIPIINTQEEIRNGGCKKGNI